MPTDQSLNAPEIKIASTLLDTNGKLIGIYQSEYRSVIQYNEINPAIEKCLIATEDNRFYEHNGLDFKALVRVFIKSIFLGDHQSGGGSTITQQLAKQFYPRPNMKNRNFFVKKFLLVKSKIKEWIIATKLENKYTKADILTMYLNKFEFINGAHGIDAAAMTYFGKQQKEISLAEAAVLVGMLKNPSLYNPVRFPDLVVKRRNEVLTKVENLYKVNLSNAKAELSDFTNYKRIEIVDTIAPYYKAFLEKYIINLIKEYNIVKADGSYYDLYGDGLTIDATIDLALQKYAEKASIEHAIWIQKWFEYDWANKDPWTYQADDKIKNLRMKSLEQKAKLSKRYQALKKKYLYPSLAKMQTTLTEDDIAILLTSESDPSIIEKLPKDRKNKFLATKKNKFYTELKASYSLFKEQYHKEFTTILKMKIFDLKSSEKYVEMSPMDSIKHLASLLQTGLIAIDPRNGHVKCWNGGLDYKYFKYDHVTSRRSVGSTLKPFLYTVAMTEKGIKPCQEFQDIAYTIMPGESDFKNKEPWQPENATKINTTLMYNLYHGLLYSKNSITVKLLKEVGSVEPLRDLLDKTGIGKNEKLANGRLAVPQLPSIALGAVDISLFQLTSAYTTFANNGTYRKPILVKSIKNKKGEVIFTSGESTTKAIDPLYNAIMLDMLINNESGNFSMKLKSPNGGKTGTTDDQCDGWFVGLTPTLVVGSWTGGDDKWIRFLRDDVGQGYFTARPVFERFIKKLESDKNGIYDPSIKFISHPTGFKELTNCKKIKTESLPEFLKPQKPVDDSLMISTIIRDSLHR
ncbi:MAG: transglycosylase domain-containing protein [Saprospiraceae bacterium]|nr:transglycosylase domain-containing protein [Saprospiraceae bacterium]